MELLIQTQAMYFASLTGGIAFALSGFLVGARNKLDWMGLFILAFLTANGGGILRDVLTDRPLSILLSNKPFLVAFSVTLVAGLLKLHRKDAIENRWLFVVADAVGLVAFAITGSLVALEINAPFFGFVTLAFLTAAGGGILRDILVNSVSDVLHSGFYGSIAILVAIAIYLLGMAHMVSYISLLVVFASALLLRLIAYRYRWQLPKL
jgi:uncharacterized membrane protein YeiH